VTEKDDERLSRAAMRSLKASMPADLKESLKRRARARKPSAWAALSGLLSGGQWAYGAGAAFAAAGLLVAVLRTVPPTPVAPAPGPRVEAPEAPAPAALADLWSDDDGGDHD
jgi:hypothetical protein